jgi:hypothetical protein
LIQLPIAEGDALAGEENKLAGEENKLAGEENRGSGGSGEVRRVEGE